MGNFARNVNMEALACDELCEKLKTDVFAKFETDTPCGNIIDSLASPFPSFVNDLFKRFQTTVSNKI